MGKRIWNSCGREKRLRGGTKVYLLWVQEATKKLFERRWLKFLLSCEWFAFLRVCLKFDLDDMIIVYLFTYKKKGMLRWGLACNIEKVSWDLLPHYIPSISLCGSPFLCHLYWSYNKVFKLVGNAFFFSISIINLMTCVLSM